MYSILTILTRRLPLLLAATALLLTPFLAATSYAKDVPIKVTYTGTLVPIPADDDGDMTHATVIDGQAKGSFGASMTHIVTEWTMAGLCDDGYVLYTLDHAAVVLTFSNGDQLFGAGRPDGWMCMDVYPLGDLTYKFYGEAGGEFTNGTGRFEGATGTFLSPFSGTNITAKDFEYGFGPITGTMEGTLTMP
jgi:hypothetical protein